MPVGVPRRIGASLVAAALLTVAGVDGAAAARLERTTGRATSSNGASSLHVRWEGLPDGVTDVSAVVRIPAVPAADHLYFWGVAAEIVDAGGDVVGSVHLGLQWDPSRASRLAVNFGGYRASGGELDGTDSALPSANGNRNTRDYSWRADVSYQLRIVGEGDGGWRGEVTDLETRTTSVVRSLWTDGDAPPVAATWSRLRPRAPAHYATYQSYDDGGCTNTSVSADADGCTQRTSTVRDVPAYQTVRCR
jgi:hypothetical protein